MSNRPPGLEVLESLFVPEALLPAQFGQARRESMVRGERALMLAVLEDAIRCLEDGPRRESRLAREAEAWIRDDDDEWPFSFLNLCANLEIDAAQLRRELLARGAKRCAPVRELSEGAHRRRRRRDARESMQRRVEADGPESMHRRADADVPAADLPRRAAQG